MEIRVPGDKSISHRALLLGALARGGSRIRGILPSADPMATSDILRELGVPMPTILSPDREIRVPGVGLRGLRTPSRTLDCGNSGTTARLLLGVLAGQPLEATLTGDESLRKRPMRRVLDPLAAMGVEIREIGAEGRLPLRIRGGSLSPLEWHSEVASAQVKSALLLAGLVGGTPVSVVEPIRSRDHTERMFRMVGVPLEEGAVEGGWRVALDSPPGSISPLDLEIPGDPSSAAFFLALGLLLDGEIAIRNVGINPTRTGILPVLARMGGEIRVEAEEGDPFGEPVATLVVRGGGVLRGTEIGGDEIPSLVDELPLLAVLASRAEGETRITGAGELRIKESDRIRVVVENLRVLGVKVEELPDGMVIQGTDRPPAGKVRTHMDHRIAMSFGILRAIPGSRVTIEDPDIADVSFPGFWALCEEVVKGDRSGSMRSMGSEAGEGDPSAAPPSAPAPAEGAGPEGDPQAGKATGRNAPFRVVTIDGPAGSGKSTTAREVARRLGFHHLDSGSLYRALTWALIERGDGPEEWAKLDPSAFDAIPLDLISGPEGFRPRLAGVVLGDELRGDRVTARVSHLAEIPAARQRLLALQREAAGLGDLVADGRDMGTVVFPEAPIKVFLTADLEERTRRRIAQEGGDPTDPGHVAQEADRLNARDRRDRERSVAPLRVPPGAIELDTTHLPFEEQVRRIVNAVRDGDPRLTSPHAGP